MIIDISKWNGIIDFAKLKKNVELVIIKASEGIGTADKKFKEYVAGCVTNNIPWGAYHFATFNSQDVAKDAATEAYFFINTIKATGQKPVVMVLDTETNDTKLPINGNKLESYCSIFLSILEREGFNAAIYMSPGFSWFLPKTHKLGKYKLWVADYNEPINPINGWKKPWLHQYTDKGTVPGINTKVDLNKFL